MIRHIVESLNRKSVVTFQRFNALTRRSQSSFRAEGAVTIIEMLVVIMVIFILAALVLAASSYVQNKGARARAETEIAAFSAALESYKADNGIYPRDNTTNGYTDTLNAKSDTDASQPVYKNASLYLYEQLAGVTSGSRTIAPSNKTYFTFKPAMLLPAPPSTADITAIRDPFGNSYGYSTANQATSSKGYNPTYDLWSTANDTIGNTQKWIKNW